MEASIPHVFVIGSSTTLLMHPYLEEMLAKVCRYTRKGGEPSQMRNAMADLDCPLGASAGDTSMVLKYLQTLDLTPTFQPDLVLLHAGMHDIKVRASSTVQQVPLTAFRGNVRRIAQWFERRSIRLVWMTAGPLDENLHNARSAAFYRYQRDLAAYGAAAESILAEHRVNILDLAGFTKRLGPLDQLLKDHVHFKDAVVRQQAAFVAGYVAATLQQ